jgi:hypothetical protein
MRQPGSDVEAGTAAWEQDKLQLVEPAELSNWLVNDAIEEPST